MANLDCVTCYKTSLVILGLLHSAIRLSRDDELKNVVVLETRLRNSKEEQQRSRQKLDTMEDTSSEYKRIQREVASLRSRLMEYKVTSFRHVNFISDKILIGGS